MKEIPRAGGRRILVSSNCQTAPIAATLQVIFPADQIDATAQPTGLEEDASIEAFADRLRRADVWVRYCDVGQISQRAAVSDALVGVSVVDIPHLNFHGFHPDLFYAFKAPGQLVEPHYNSGIIVWCYRNGIDPGDVGRLFNRETFSALGYFGTWDSSVDSLSSICNYCGLDWRRLYMRLKRFGVFMHGVNHPIAPALVSFGKTIALRLHAHDDIWDRVIEFPDEDAAHWPVYPEIGRYLALPGRYEWIYEQQRYDLDQYIHHSYSLYADAGISTDRMELNATAEIKELFDRALLLQLRGKG